MLLLCVCIFFCSCYCDPRVLRVLTHSFPTRRSSDLGFVEAARAKGVRVDILRDAREAVAGADLVVTDTWVSMGQNHAHNKIAAMASRSEEHTSELQSLMRISYAVFCLKKKKNKTLQ